VKDTLSIPVAEPELSAAKRALIDARLRGRGRASAIGGRGRSQDVPLSFAQERLWFLERVGQGGVAYHIPTALPLPPDVDEAALARALGEIVRRHDALRTTFREVDGVPMQSVRPFEGFDLPVDDVSGLEEAERDAAVRRLSAAEAARPFDLTTGPLFRGRLLRLGGGASVLLLVMHHIVSDGWSMRVLFEELWTLHDAYRQGRESPLPALPVQYTDYALWQREQPHGAEAVHLEYWRTQLAGAPEVLELPLDHPRPSLPTFGGGRVPVDVPGPVSSGLRTLARAESATLYMVVLAAFQVLLGRYAATDDVVVGAPIAGRTRAEVGGLIGFFVNTLVLRTDLTGNPTFREVVRRVREVLLGAYEHQDLPFERLVAELRPERTLSHSSLFQVMFMLDTAGGDRPVPQGVEAAAEGVELNATKFDLTLALDAYADGIRGALDYSTDLFERTTAERMVEHLQRVLEQVVEDPDRPLASIDLMREHERHQVVTVWNDTAAPYPADRCIHTLFEAQVARTPEAPAVRAGGRTLTFRELDARANRLAHRLRGMGVGPEVRVGIFLERGIEAMVAIFGVLKAGGAFVPLDGSYPPERLAFMLQDSGVRVLLTQEPLRGRTAPPEGVPVVCIEATELDPGADGSDPPETGVTPENLAYVIYTSGSTGRPKGVAMHHRGVANYIHWGIAAYGADRGNGAPVFSSFAVDLTITNLLPLFAGLPVLLLPEEDPIEALAETLRGGPEFGLIKITPLHLTLVTPLLTPEEARAAALTLVVGADFLVAEPTVFWQDHAPGVRLMNEYGPTETVVGCSAYVLPNGLHRAGPVPVGGPIQNIRFYVLDPQLRPVPVGLAGELYIGGEGVARGYLGRPGLTAEKFVPEPFAGPGARMYRTGDRARWLAGGNLLILGRTDHQVKIRGFRVELGEVESLLRRDAEVTDCLVTVREDRPGDRRLVAYVVGDPRRLDPRTLRESLRQSVPEYMVPSAVMVLAALPQTSTGKLDRKTLPAPQYERADLEADEPRDYLEVQLIRIWEELLDVSLIGPSQSFFDLGGNSLLALRLFAQVNRRLDCDLPVSTLFTGATVRQMAEAIRAQRRSAPAAPAAVVPLHAEGTHPPLFLVHSADRDVMGYVNLVRHLDVEQPVYGLRDVGDDLSRPLARIAADHIEALRSVQPHGPYYVAGWSFGGFVAYEMALQLEALDEPVAFVGMLDTMAPPMADAWPWSGDADVLVGLAHDVASVARRPFSLPPGALDGLDPEAQVQRVVEVLNEQGAAPPGFDAAALAEQARVIRARNRSREGYVPRAFPGTVSLFRADGLTEYHARFFADYGEEETDTRGWCSLAADGVEVYPVPGEHATITAEPHARVLAQAVRTALAAARARAGTPAAVAAGAA
jgi:amino acid adenylation domain-containing protein